MQLEGEGGRTITMDVAKLVPANPKLQVRPEPRTFYQPHKTDKQIAVLTAKTFTFAV